MEWNLFNNLILKFLLLMSLLNQFKSKSYVTCVTIATRMSPKVENTLQKLTKNTNMAVPIADVFTFSQRFRILKSIMRFMWIYHRKNDIKKTTTRQWKSQGSISCPKKITIYCCLHQRLKSALSAGLQILIPLLANLLPNVPQQFDGTKDLVGFSPTGVVWMVSSIFCCLSSVALSFREVLVRMEHVKIMPTLISEVHLKILKCWSEPGGGNDGVRDVVNPVIDLLAFPFVPVQNVCGLPSASESVNRGFLLNMMGSPGVRLGIVDKDMVKVIESNMPEYIKILCEVGKPGCICRCLDHAELKNLGRPVAFLVKMTGHQCLALKLLEKDLLNPSTVRNLLDGSSPRELVLEVLMIVSDLARMDKARHNIISLLIDRRVDFACFAIGNAAFPNNLLYEELRRSIPLLMCCF